MGKLESTWDYAAIYKNLTSNLTAKVADDSFHDITKNPNWRSKLAQFAGGQVATPCEPDDDAETGNSKRSYSRRSDGGGRGIEQPWEWMALKPCTDKAEENEEDWENEEKTMKQKAERR